MSFELAIDRVQSRYEQSVDQLRAQHFETVDLSPGYIDVVVSRTCIDGALEMMKRYSSRPEIVTEDRIGEIPPAAQYLAGTLDRFIEMEILQTVQRIVMDKRAHRPVIGDDLAREPNQPAKLHSQAFAVSGRRARYHALISRAARSPWFIRSDGTVWRGAMP